MRRVCCLCRKTQATKFGWRDNARTGESAHTECLGIARQYGDLGGKAWANAQAWGRPQLPGI